MTLTQLEYIVAVDKFRHFGKAAAFCHVSQPSLSAQIQKLEAELEVRIFERTKNSCAVTDVGKDVLAQARLILDEVRRVEDVVASFRTEVKGTLRLGVIPTIAPFLLPSILPALRKSHPALKLEIFEQTTGELVKRIDTGELDAAILSTPRTAPASLREWVLYYEPFVLFTAPAHPLRACNPLVADDLEKYVPHLLDDTHCMRDQVVRLCAASMRDDSAVQFRSGGLQTLVEVVSSSGGYTLLPALAQESFRKSHPKCFQPFSDPQPSRKVSLVFHRSFLKKPLIQALATLIERELPPGVLPPAQKSDAKIIDPGKDRFRWKRSRS